VSKADVAVASEAIKAEMSRLGAASSGHESVMNDLHVKQRSLKMELDTAKEDVTLAEERAKEAETKERDAEAQVMILRRQVHQLKEHEEKGLVRARSIASATNPSSSDAKSKASEAEESKPTKGVKREREDDGGKEDAEASKRANQATQAELEQFRSVAESRLAEVTKLRGVQAELTQKCRALEDRSKDVTDEEAVKSSAYTLLNFKFNEALREQDSVAQTLDSQQWRIDKEEAVHRLELEKARTNSLQQHTVAMSELKDAQGKVGSLTAERDSLKRKLEAAEGSSAQGNLTKETKELCLVLQAENARQKAENERLKKQVEGALKRAEAAETGNNDAAVAAMKGSLESKDAEIEEYLGELAEIGTEADQMRAQNGRLVAQLTEKEDSNTRLVSEKIKSKQNETLLRGKHKSLELKVAAADKAREAAEGTQVKIEAQLQCAVAQCQNHAATEQLVNQLVESHKNSAREALQLFNNSRSQLEVSQAALEGVHQRAKANEDALLAKTHEHQRVSEEVTAMSKKLEYFQKIHSGAKKVGKGGAAEQELSQLKQLISCPIQNTQRIGMDQFCVVAKCWHVFSKAGIDVNLANRNRKCPACGLTYDKADVHDIFITN